MWSSTDAEWAAELARRDELMREFHRLLEGRLRRSNEEMDAEVEQMLDEAGVER